MKTVKEILEIITQKIALFENIANKALEAKEIPKVRVKCRNCGFTEIYVLYEVPKKCPNCGLEQEEYEPEREPETAEMQIPSTRKPWYDVVEFWREKTGPEEAWKAKELMQKLKMEIREMVRQFVKELGFEEASEVYGTIYLEGQKGFVEIVLDYETGKLSVRQGTCLVNEILQKTGLTLDQLYTILRWAK